MSQRDFDLIVIGAGSGRCSRGARRREPGAASPSRKNFASADLRHQRLRAEKTLCARADFATPSMTPRFGWSVEPPRFDWSRLVRPEKEITRLEGFTRKISKKRRRTDSPARRGGGWRNRAIRQWRDGANENDSDRHGGAPVMAPRIPASNCDQLNEIFDLPTFPKRLLVIARAISRSIRRRFWQARSETHVAFRPELPLRGFDLDLRKRLAAAMTQDGVTLHAARRRSRWRKLPAACWRASPVARK